MNGLKQGSTLQGWKYRIERTLGQGGFGITYAAVQVALSRRVAIKEFFMKDFCERNADTSHVTMGTAGGAQEAKRFKEKFMKEASLIAQFDNPHIVRIYDIFEENGTAYYVMEFLEDRWSQFGENGIPQEQSLNIIRQVGEGLSYIHSQNVLHLDVKPSNIMFRKDCAVLIDFGISKRYDSEGGQTSATPVGISKGYAPMEQYNQGVQTFQPATDVYSLGATLYKLLTGKTPPEACEVNENGIPPCPSNVSPILWKAIVKAMQPRRKDRPQSIAEFLALLDTDSTEMSQVNPMKDDETVVSIKPEPVVQTTPASSSSSFASSSASSSPVPPAPKPTPTPRSFWPYVAAVVGVCIGLGGLFFRGCKGTDEPISEVEALSTPEASPASQTFEVGDVSFKMIRVDGGTFTMGATPEQASDADDGEKPAHQVTLSSYYIGETEVTQALWETVMGSNPSSLKGTNRPVEYVSWDDCKTFISKLNSITGKNFRLPTEAEWEYAAKGGNKSHGYEYSGSNEINDVAWYDDNACDGVGESSPDYGTHNVKTKKPNELGLYDMSGNVKEWCEDLFDSSGSYRVYRGGGWDYYDWSCSVSFRNYGTPDNRHRHNSLGLRLAL